MSDSSGIKFEINELDNSISQLGDTVAGLEEKIGFILMAGNEETAPEEEKVRLAEGGTDSRATLDIQGIAYRVRAITQKLNMIYERANI